MATKTLTLLEGMQFLHDTGLLFEVNRRVLQPHGLAMRITCPDEDPNRVVAVDFISCRDTDREGGVFLDEAFDYGMGKLKAFMEDPDTIDRLIERDRVYGFVEQIDHVEHGA